MTDSFISQLLDFGALGIFAGFLIWQHMKMQGRLDKLIEGFQSQLKEIEGGHEGRIEKMRLRYDSVIEAYRKEAKECHDMMADCKHAIATQMQESNTKLEQVAEDVRTGLSEMRDHYRDMEIAKEAKKLAKEAAKED